METHVQIPSRSTQPDDVEIVDAEESVTFPFRPLNEIALLFKKIKLNLNVFTLMVESKHCEGEVCGSRTERKQ